jgi:hypothetical protein
MSLMCEQMNDLNKSYCCKLQEKILDSNLKNYFYTFAVKKIDECLIVKMKRTFEVRIFVVRHGQT